jgi:hypothetical protein
LNIRALLATSVLEIAGVGVSSVTTLDTPHEGSVGADFTEEFARDSQFVDLTGFQGFLLRQAMASQLGVGPEIETAS